MFIFITYQWLLWELIEYILGKFGLILSSFVHARDSAGKAVWWAPRPWGVSSGPPRKHSSLRAVLDWLAFSDPDAEGQPPRKGKQGKDPLVQCVKTFCCQVAGLIHWLWNTAAVSTTCLHPSPVRTGLKPSLQLDWQFKRDIDEQSVLQKGEILPQCERKSSGGSWGSSVS